MDASLEHKRCIQSGLDTGKVAVALSTARPDEDAGDLHYGAIGEAAAAAPTPLPLAKGITGEALDELRDEPTSDDAAVGEQRHAQQRTLVPALAAWFVGNSGSGQVTVSDVRACPFVPGAATLPLAERKKAMKHLVKHGFLTPSAPGDGGVHHVIRNAPNAQRVLAVLEREEMAGHFKHSDGAVVAAAEVRQVVLQLAQMPTETMPSQLEEAAGDGQSPLPPVAAEGLSLISPEQEMPPVIDVADQDDGAADAPPPRRKGKRRVLFAGSQV